MDVFMFILGVIALVVVVPIALIGHFIIRWRSVRGLTPDEERMVAELYETAERLRNRVTNLERVLDAEVPGWRSER